MAWYDDKRIMSGFFEEYACKVSKPFEERRENLIGAINRKSRGSTAHHGGPDYMWYRDLHLLHLEEENEKLRQEVSVLHQEIVICKQNMTALVEGLHRAGIVVSPHEVIVPPKN